MTLLNREDPRIPELLQRSIQKRFGGRTATVKTNDVWMGRIWQYLTTVGNVAAFKHVTLLPVRILSPSQPLTDPASFTLLPLDGIYLCSKAADQDPLPSSLGSALIRLGITVLQNLPDCVMRHWHVVGNFVNNPSRQGVLRSVMRVSDDAALRKRAISSFNGHAKKEEKRALVQFLGGCAGASVSLPLLLHQLRLFKTSTNQSTCVGDVPLIGPADLPPTPLPMSLLVCDSLEGPAARCLGARDVALSDLVQDIMRKLSSRNTGYSKEEIVRFMMFYLKMKSLTAQPALQKSAREIAFVRTESGELKKAEDVYDPSSSLLRKLFCSQEKTMFPHGDFARPEMVKKLKKLGLRSEQDVKAADIISTAKRASSMPANQKAITSNSLLKYLQMHGDRIDRYTLETISGIPCLPCLQETERPNSYPCSLPIKSTPSLLRPGEMSTSTMLSVTGSVVPTLVQGISEEVSDHLGVIREARPEDVLQHLKNVTLHFSQQEASKYKLILYDIFMFIKNTQHVCPWVINSLQEQECILVESGERFASPKNIWIHCTPDDIDLKPYRFRLPVEMMALKDLMQKCGSSENQNTGVLHSVLVEIKNKHLKQGSPHPDFNTDFQLVKQILDTLKRCDSACDGCTLLPVVHNQSQVLRFMPAEECTIITGPPRNLHAMADVGFEIYYVHPDVSTSTALDLGAKLMKDRALTGVEDLDYGYGQHEDLTSRLHSLLKEAYTDGFSVPKELIQNADDAGATKVCFLLDERENMNSRSNLITDTMASLQGPAIWAYNNAVFTESDFENIVKLGAGTKKADTSKVGRFGLGFNAVYNLTDVPCFLSGTKLAMFDPQVKYLGKGKGLQLDFTKPINRALLGRMPEQFEPFQDVFGCELNSTADTNYRGTLFRFPLRTAEQAADSKLKNDSYSEVKRRDFLRMLLEKAGSLLMFTQNVKEVEVYHLPANCPKPTEQKCLLTVRKTCESTIVIQPQLQLANKTILQFMKAHWTTMNKDIRIQQKLRIEVTCTANAKAVCGVEERNSVTHWKLAWASGMKKSAKMTHLYRQEGLVPLAAVASLSSEDGLIPLKNSPQGFYKTGHLFCFLPLPEEMVHVTLSVHINGTFALTSDRRGLLVQTEDDLGIGEASWNPVLFGDPVVRAYLLLLEQVKEEAEKDSDFSRYFDLWPKSSVTCLVDSFYQCLHSASNKILPVAHQNVWVSFADAFFLDPDFRNSDCGLIAWECLQKVWGGTGYLVDVPRAISQLMRDKGPPGSFDKKVITELAFYRDYFFPNLGSGLWLPEHRDILIHHALMKNSEQINQLLKENPCIPCEHSSQLRKPNELIHPSRQAAQLFLASEGRFPQGQGKQTSEAVGNQASHTVNFGDFSSLSCLSRLGMITDDLPWDMVLERARSVETLINTGDKQASLARASHLIEYLSATRLASSAFAFENCPSEVKESLSKTAFLPVLHRPEDWAFPWAGCEPSDGCILASSSELFSDNLRHLVACHAKVLDSKALKGTAASLTGKTRQVVETLGVVVHEDYSNPRLIQFVLKQLQTVAEHHNADSRSIPLTSSISTNIYTYFTRALRRAETNDNTLDTIKTSLGHRCIIWTGAGFVQPSVTAFLCRYDCSPYLFQLERSLQSFRPFFEVVGVKAEFDASDVLSVLETLNEKYAGVQMKDDQVALVSRLAHMLGEIVKTFRENSPLDTERVFLPDRHGNMQPACCLCVDDCEWLAESTEMKFVHGKIAPETAFLLGVKTKKRQDFDTLSEPIYDLGESFGQSEELTSRIKRLLEGYTFDSSLCKELLQNADDAGATEAKFIMDFRRLGTDTVPDKLEALQGPALCFFNNRSFSKEDMQGIQSLGVGSKAQDALKIGQFGVGFNAVFHVTDVPSFWTREDDDKDVICVLDPNCQYVLNTKPNKPGIKFTKFDRLRKEYPDFLSGYLSSAIDMSQPGTLFRFPLRTEAMAKQSKIKDEVVTETVIRKLLSDFRTEVGASLLFLNNLRKIGIYSVTEKGTLKQDFEVKRILDDSSSKQLSDFKAALQQASQVIKKNLTGVLDVPDFEAVVQSKLTDSNENSEEWLTVHRLGFKGKTELSTNLLTEWSQRNFKLLPHGGVAVKLAEETNGTSSRADPKAQHQAFCILPLPVHTGLPMHVNGHFALDHETRRNLWDSENQEDIRSLWNNAVALNIIAPAYVTALQNAKHALFLTDTANIKQVPLASHLQQYHNLLPKLCEAKAEIWKKLIQEVYRTLAREELPVFPVTGVVQDTPEWVPAVCGDGFSGFFNNLTAHFLSKTDREDHQKHVVLSQGHTSAPAHTASSQVKAKEKATEMVVLLKTLNMKVLETPFHVYENFKASGVEEVQQVTAKTVISFLRSSGQATKGACNIDGLPKPVQETPLSAADNVRKLVEFVREDEDFLGNLNGLPLCLRQSGVLYSFSSSTQVQKPIISKFSLLLPGSAEEFLHACVIQYFESSEGTKAVLQQLTVQMFAERLRGTLKDPCLRAGKPCKFVASMFPPLPGKKFWLKHLWEFLESQFKENTPLVEENALPEQAKGNTFSKQLTDKPKSVKDQLKSDEKKLRSESEEMLHCLKEWCLIPARKKHGDQEQQILYPIRDLHKVVYLSATSSQSNSQLWTILKKLPLPLLDQLPSSNIATKLVASIRHPVALLHALTSCADHLSASHDNGRTILEYFNNNLAILKESCSSETNLPGELRSLPVFPAIDGSLVATKAAEVLCLQSDIPSEGLQQWSQRRNQPLMLLRAAFVPESLLEYLGFDSLTNDRFYSQYLLPTIDFLPQHSIAGHMDFIREKFFRSVYSFDDMTEEQKQLSLQLQITAFIVKDGTLHRAQEFYTPHDVVFKVMCTSESFPPEPYCHSKWNGLMTAAGIKCKVTEDMFVAFARAVEREGSDGITNGITEKSLVLVNHLFTRENLTGTGLLAQLRSIRFLLPLDWMSVKDGSRLTKIAKPFCQKQLLAFEDSSFEEHLHLVWSSSCLLHPDCDPRQYFFKPKQLNMVLSQLGLQQKAQKDRVMQHARNMCQSLGGEKGRDIFLSFGDNKRLLIIIMETLYRYLEDNVKSNNDIASLRQMKLICDIENNQMLHPANVVVDLRPHEMIKGHIEKAPHHFGRYFGFFKKLGAAESATANHYAAVLSWLKKRSGNAQLNVEEMKIVKTAVDGLFRCLKQGTEEQKIISERDLYLPAENQSLQKSTGLICKDDYLGERFSSPPEGMHFFLGFQKLEIKKSFAVDDARKLPREHRMVMLSEVVQEVIPDHIQDAAQDTDISNPVTAKLLHPKTKQAVVRLVHHEYKRHDQAFTEETAREIEQKLVMDITVKEVSGLQTILTLRNEPVPGSEQCKVSFTLMTRGQRKTAVVYIAAESLRNWREHSETWEHSLAIGIEFVLETELRSYLLHQVLKRPEKAMALLDKERIATCRFGSAVDDTVFPPAGTFVPLKFHCHLNNSFFDFYKGEHVGFEVFDPQIDDDMPDTSAAGEGNIPVYIYGIVVDEVYQQCAVDASQLARRYRVDLGPDRGTVEVSVIKLYKFVRRTTSDPTALVQQDDATADAEPPPEFKAVLREIRALLTEAWQLPNKSDRKHVVKRLLLQWHPDKNHGNEEFCTRVTQAIMHYVSLLDQGQQLPADDDDDYNGACRDEDFNRPGSSFRPSFFTNMHARGCSHRRYYDSEPRSNRRGGWRSRGYGGWTDTDPNPQPGESQRWFRQAQADVTAARAAAGTSDRGNNWICYQCHQVSLIG